jgi:hypothetical protein
MKLSPLVGMVALLLVSSAALAEEEKTQLNSGIQYIVNHSDRTVTVAIGDFVPTPYTLAPGEATVAYVSSDRQTITIRTVR